MGSHSDAPRRRRQPTRAPRRALAPAWTLIQATPDDWTAPCWTRARRGTLIFVGPCQGPAAHIHEATARRALAQLNQPPARPRTPRHT